MHENALQILADSANGERKGEKDYKIVQICERIVRENPGFPVIR